MPEEACRRWVIQGRVQGVGFRWFVQSRAARLGVKGWARNLPDGGVEVVGRAAEAALTSLDELVRRGPVGARVTEVTSTEVPHDSVDIAQFEIRAS